MNDWVASLMIGAMAFAFSRSIAWTIASVSELVSFAIRAQDLVAKGQFIFRSTTMNDNEKKEMYEAIPEKSVKMSKEYIQQTGIWWGIFFLLVCSYLRYN